MLKQKMLISIVNWNVFMFENRTYQSIYSFQFSTRLLLLSLFSFPYLLSGLKSFPTRMNQRTRLSLKLCFYVHVLPNFVFVDTNFWRKNIIFLIRRLGKSRCVFCWYKECSSVLCGGLRTLNLQKLGKSVAFSTCRCCFSNKLFRLRT